MSKNPQTFVNHLITFQNIPNINRFDGAPLPDNEVSQLRTHQTYFEGVGDHLSYKLLSGHLLQPDYQADTNEPKKCVMMFLNQRWSPGLKRAFTWKLVPCNAKMHVTVSICQVKNATGNGTVGDNRRSAVFFMDELGLLKPMLRHMCETDNFITVTQIGQSLVVTSPRMTANTKYQLEVELARLKPVFYYGTLHMCLNTLELPDKDTKEQSRMSVIVSSGTLRMNSMQCTNATSIVLDGVCMTMRKSNSLATIFNNVLLPNVTNDVKHVLDLMIHHRICKIKIKGSFPVANSYHPWCDSSNVVEVVTNHVSSTRKSCGSQQIQCPNEECVSEWLVGHARNPCTTRISTHNLSPDNLPYFICVHKPVPWYRVCDGVTDCHDNTDESQCAPQLITKPLPRSVSVFTPTQTPAHTPLHIPHDACAGMFCCGQTKQAIPLAWVDDLIPDCPITSPDTTMSHDEPLLQVINPISVTCTGVHELPCIPGHPRCFPISSLCIYDLDEYGHLRYCRNGDHLEGCQHSQCPDMYKCPGSYCLPVLRVCDGRSDCPHGEDEVGCPPGDLVCPWFLRCQTGGCVHQKEVCDGKLDCPVYGDDELFCEVDIHLCPEGCVCTWLAILCLHTKIEHIEARNIKYIRLEQILPKVPEIRKGDKLLVFNMSGSELVTVGRGSFLGIPFVAMIDLSFNRITLIQSHSFHNLSNLRHIRIDNNQIDSIEDMAFMNLPKLSILNLSFSITPSLNPQTIKESSLDLIDLAHTELESIDFNAFEMLDMVHLIINLTHTDVNVVKGNARMKNKTTIMTHIHYLCCFIEENLCHGQKALVNLCFNIFPEATYRPEWVLACFTLLINIAVMLLRMRRKQAIVQSAQMGVNLIGIGISISELLVALQGGGFDPSYVQAIGGNRHRICLASSALQYGSVLAVFPMICLRMYAVYVIFNNNPHSIIFQHKYASWQVNATILTSLGLVSIVYLVMGYTGMYPDLSELCSVYIPTSPTNYVNRILMCCQLCVHLISCFYFIGTYILLLRSLKNVQDELASFEHARVTSFDVMEKGRHALVKFGLLPLIIWGIPFLVIGLVVLSGHIPSMYLSWISLTVIFPCWTMMNPAEYMYENVRTLHCWRKLQVSRWISGEGRT